MMEVWIHEPTAVLALVEGNFGEFMWNGKMEESFWGIFREDPASGWIRIGLL